MEPVDVYRRVLEVTNYFLKNSELMTFDNLKELDPNIETIAKALRMLANVLKELAGDSYEDQDMAINAFQCCLIMEQIAHVVMNDHEDGMGELIRQLEMHVSVP